ncbi:MAG: hypothetical protein LUI13_12580 [Lachnospiraceae bacterium]|nr:hypothetical protein [Lachnospiraceae bacterium]
MKRKTRPAAEAGSFGWQGDSCRFLCAGADEEKIDTCAAHILQYPQQFRTKEAKQ